MGVDSFIFDEVSKDCFYFDRRYNLLSYNQDDALAEDIKEKILTVRCGRATSGEIVYLCDSNIDYYLHSPEVEERERRRAGWNEAIKKFALDRPDGSFFTLSDHDNDYSHDYIRKHGYRDIGEEP